MRRLVLRQPSWRVRSYELVEDGLLRGTLAMRTLRGVATATTDDRSWELARSGLLRPRVAATRAGIEEASAQTGGLRGRGTIQIDGRAFGWRRAGGVRSRYVVVDGESQIVRVSVQPRRECRLEIEAGVGAAPLLLLLSSFLALLREDENAVATTTVGG